MWWCWWGTRIHSPPPPDSLHPSLLLPSHFPFGGNYLFLKRAPEQTRWEIPLNKSSVFPDSLSLALQTKLVGWGWDFPRPLLVLEGLTGGGSSQECQAAAAAAPLLTAGRAGALPPSALKGKPAAPTPDRRDLNAETGSTATHRLRPRSSSAKWDKYFLLYLPPRLPRAGAGGEGVGIPPREGRLAGSRPTHHPPAAGWGGAPWGQPRARGLAPPF